MDETNWYYSDNGRPTGPISLTELRQLFASGRLTAHTLVWHATLVQWMAASQVPGLLQAVPPAPPIPPAPSFSYGYVGAGAPGSHHGMAVAAFVLSILGLLPCPCVGWLLAIVGIILGAVALSGMSRTHNRDGYGLALAAVIIGVVACMVNCGVGGFMAHHPGPWRYDFRRDYHWNV